METNIIIGQHCKIFANYANRCAEVMKEVHITSRSNLEKVCVYVSFLKI